MKGRLGIVLAGGPLTVRAGVRSRLAAATDPVVIAADGGLRHARTLGLTPALLVGDFDSVAEADRYAFPRLDERRLDPDKDALDLELAIDEARDRGATELLLLGALGGRFDQSLAALLIAAHLTLDGVPTRLHGRHADAAALAPGTRLALDAPAGTTFSLVALTDGCRVSVAGARYELERAALPFGRGLGVSNRVTGRAEIVLHAGLAAAVTQWRLDDPPGEETA